MNKLEFEQGVASPLPDAAQTLREIAKRCLEAAPHSSKTSERYSKTVVTRLGVEISKSDNGDYTIAAEYPVFDASRQEVTAVFFDRAELPSAGQPDVQRFRYHSHHADSYCQTLSGRELDDSLGQLAILITHQPSIVETN